MLDYGKYNKPRDRIKYKFFLKSKPYTRGYSNFSNNLWVTLLGSRVESEVAGYFVFSRKVI